MAAELNPCPFCGGQAYIFRCTDGKGKSYYGVTCEGWHYPKDLYETEAEAIDAWNGRIKR